MGLQSIKCGSSWTLTNIYAPGQDDKKPEFLNWLVRAQIREDVEWLLVGDFNLIRNPDDKSKPGGKMSEMLQFNIVISHLGLVDI